MIPFNQTLWGLFGVKRLLTNPEYPHLPEIMNKITQICMDKNFLANKLFLMLG